MISLEEYKRAYREIRREEERRGFLIHLTVYIFVNAMLIAINLIYTPKKIWFFYPLFGWGIGVIAVFSKLSIKYYHLII